MRRIHIIGGPGSGKTTLASRLGAQLHAEPIHLDRVAYDPPGDDGAAPFGSWTKVGYDERRRRTEAIAAGPSWITEGVYAGWTEPLIAAADVVVWLDPPARIAAWRVGRRYIEHRLSRSADHRGLRLLWMLLRRAAIGYPRGAVATGEQLRRSDAANSRSTTMAQLAPYEASVRRCRTKRDLLKLLAEVSEAGGSSARAT